MQFFFTRVGNFFNGVQELGVQQHDGQQHDEQLVYGEQLVQHVRHGLYELDERQLEQQQHGEQQLGNDEQ